MVGATCVSTLNKTTNGNGFIETRTTLDRPLVTISTLVANQDHGVVGVWNAATNTLAGGITGAGQVFGSTKNFVVPHPNKQDKLIIYTSLEGPTADIYDRGRIELRSDSVWIEFKDHFAALLSSPESITAQLTPFRGRCGELYVANVESTGFEIRRFGGEAQCHVFWTVHGIRAGYEDEPVVVDRDCNSFTTLGPDGHSSCERSRGSQ